MKKTRTRIWSILLALALVLSLLPATALAEETEDEPGTEEDIPTVQEERPALLALTGTGTETDPYQVSEAGDLTAALAAGGHIRVMDSFDVTALDTTVVDKTVVLDLNGYTITWNSPAKNSFQVPSGGSLTVCDNSSGGNGELKIVNTYGKTVGAGIEVSTGGAMTLESGTVSACLANTSSYVVRAYGNFDMSGGTLALDGSATTGVYLSANDDAPSSFADGTIEFRGTETNSKQGINTYRTATLSNMTVDGSKLNNAVQVTAVYNSCSGTSARTVTIEGGTYSANDNDSSYAVRGSGKKTYIQDGTFNGVVQSTTGLISGGRFSVEPASQYAASGKVFQLDTSDNYYKLVDGSYVGRIGNVGYLSWDELFAACGDSSSATTVYLLSDAGSITVPANVNVEFRNINKVTVGSLINNGTCEIYLYAMSGTQVTNNGTLILSHEVGSLTNNQGGTVTTGSGSAVVTGDVVNHGTMTISGGKYLGSVSNDGGLTITGGSYRSVDDITVEDTENYGFYKIQDSTYGDLFAVYEKADVQAQVGEYYYTKWNTAALNATAQQPAKLLADLTLSPSSASPLNINSGSDYYLDLNGHTMNLQGKSASNYGFKISKGSLNLYNSQPASGGIVFNSYNNNGDGTAFWMGGRMNDEGPDAAVLRVAEGVKITSDAYSINMMTSGATDKYGVAVYFDGILHTLYGPYINGQYNNMEGSVPVFNFLEHSEIHATSVGLYAAGFAQWNLAGDITSENAEPLSVKSGVFHITGGTYTANGAFHDPADTNSNGSEATGAALSITSNDGYAKKIEVTVTGGEFISENGYAVYEGIAKKGTAPAAKESYATLSISGGTFRGNDVAGAVNISTAQNKQVISGGTFLTANGNVSNISSYLPAGNTQDKTGKVGMADGVVAVIGSAGYTALADALNAAASQPGDSATIRLLDNVSMDSTYTMDTDKNITLDLGGKTLTLSRFNLERGQLTVQNGDVECSGQAFNVYAAPASDGSSDYYTKLTLAKDATIKAAFAICLFPEPNSNYGANSAIEVFGEIENGGIFVSGNLGNDTTSAGNMVTSSKIPTITIYEGAVVNNGTEGQGIAMNGLANVTVNGGTITGSEAIGVKRGKLTVNGGTFISNGKYVDSAEANNNGTENTGATISITGTYNYAGSISVTLNGGDFTSKNAPAVYLGHSKKGDALVPYENGVTLDINGGTFIAPTNMVPVYVADSTQGDANTYTKQVVNGGSYSQSVRDYVTDERNAELKSGSDATAPYRYYQDLEAAQAAAQPGDTITLLSEDLNTVTLTLKYNDGIRDDLTYILAENGSITLPVPTRSDYTFAGWRDGTNIYADGTEYKVTQDTILIAQWRSNDSSSSSSGSGSSSVSGDYIVNVSSVSGGKVTVNPGRADKGDEVTITAIPNDGYVLQSLTVTDKDGDTVRVSSEGRDKYTFTMPGGAVTVKAVFVREGDAVVTPEVSFTDVAESFWAYNEINWAAENGYMTGTTATTFNPGGTVTRQQVWMILARMAGADPANMAEAKSWAVSTGISDGTNPGGAVSRQQLVALLYRFAGQYGYDVSAKADLSGYPDVASLASYAADAMAWSVANGIIGGTTQGTLNPAGTANRAQFAVILWRFYQTTAV